MEAKFCSCGHNQFMHDEPTLSEWVKLSKKFKQHTVLVSRIFTSCHATNCRCLHYVERTYKLSRTPKVELKNNMMITDGESNEIR